MRHGHDAIWFFRLAEIEVEHHPVGRFQAGCDANVPAQGHFVDAVVQGHLGAPPPSRPPSAAAAGTNVV